jgi:multiple sugar transport system ATP-binding protein
VRQPAVFLFDEPLSNLDAKLRIEMRTEIKKLHQRLGKTSVYVTHDQVEAMTLASRIAVMDQGHIRQFAPPAEVYNDPADLFVAGFMGSPPMNMLEGTVQVGDGVHIVVEGGGEAIAFPAPHAQRDRVAAHDGRNVILGLRPETIGAAGQDHGAEESFGFVREVEVVEPTGPDTLLIFPLGGVEATARVRPEDEQPAGTPFHFTVDMSKAKVFDPTSGKRI